MTRDHIQAAHYHPGRRRPIRLVVLHATQGGEGPGRARNVAAGFHDPHGRVASAHAVADAGVVIDCVHDADTAFGAVGANADGLHLEQCGMSEQDRAHWLDPASLATIGNGAARVAEWCRAYAIPPVQLGVKQVQDLRSRGITDHATVSKAFPGCVTADSPVLCADLTWRPAGDLLEGDELVGFDEHSERQVGRKLHRSVVTRNAPERRMLVRVNTPKGSVRCTLDHPWLTRRGRPGKWGAWTWVEAADLVPGDDVMHVADPWPIDRSWAAGWLAGMYDGEGSLSWSRPGPRDRNGYHGLALECAQRVSPTADEMLRAVKDLVETQVVYRDKGPGRQPQIVARVTRRTDIMRVLGQVRPPRLLAMADRVWEGGNLGKSGTRTTVETVEPCGSGLIAALTTSTATYIAGGFAMHNTGHWDPGPAYPWDVFLDRLHAHLGGAAIVPPAIDLTHPAIFIPGAQWRPQAPEPRWLPAVLRYASKSNTKGDLFRNFQIIEWNPDEPPAPNAIPRDSIAIGMDPKRWVDWPGTSGADGGQTIARALDYLGIGA